MTCPFRSMVSITDKLCNPSCAFFDGVGCCIDPFKVEGNRLCPLTERNSCSRECAFDETCVLKKSINARKKGIRNGKHLK